MFIKLISYVVFLNALVFYELVNRIYAKNPENYKLEYNLLKPCPKSPNCVFSLSKNPQNSIHPIRFNGSLISAKEKLKKVIKKFSNAKFVIEAPLYWHIEFTSRWWEFIDDMQIIFDESESQIHLRSASRVGYWDLGVNRRRVEKIRLQFNKIITQKMN
tara:strand:- start:267 stop:743 length:477 start_codon:yes stop_codon:yes gene_type:complete